jgi:hypothetical protein
MAVRLPMHLHRRFGIRRVDQAEARISARIIPVGDEIDPLIGLNFHIAPMGFGDIGGCEACHVVSVEKDWHGRLAVLPFEQDCRRVGHRSKENAQP